MTRSIGIRTRLTSLLPAGPGSIFLFLFLLPAGCATTPSHQEDEMFEAQAPKFAGSESCRPCHERFYQKWEGSRHGTAMLPFVPELISTQAAPAAVEIGDYRYTVELGEGTGEVVEEGPQGRREYPIVHALGGKNIYYFLTPMERGRLQVLPVAFDVELQEWFDTTGSMVRHFREGTDEALHWTERPLTFNTSCYSCHVSQLSTNYDPAADRYQTTWGEPGINCETCHGPGGEHVRAAEALAEDEPMTDPKIIVTTDFSSDQLNDMCAPCHAKMFPISTDFGPGDRFFDHFGLVALEHADFYPDGRDLGENYTYTHWLMNPCAAESSMDCMDCHTSSGRDRNAENPDNACMPCHQEYVLDPASHSFHPPESEGSRCIACHMPKTTFARMDRHDHTFLPPVPAATLEFGSPNACNICHEEQDAAWSDRWVRKWYRSDYQAEYLHRARLIQAARDEEWEQLPQILDYISSPDRDPVFAASLLRLLYSCPREEKWPAVLQALEDPSPLVRYSAVDLLDANPSRESVNALFEALGDEFGIVRIRAVAALSSMPLPELGTERRQQLARALDEYKKSLLSRPDDWSFQYTLGNFYLNRNQPLDALESFEKSHRLQPRAVPPLVNASMALARLGRNSEAEAKLRQALELESDSATTHFNLGLLLAETGDQSAAERHLRSALEADPDFAEAAFNLSVLVAQGNSRDEAIRLSGRAFDLHPDNPRYGYTHAFYLFEAGRFSESRDVLLQLVDAFPGYSDALGLLAENYRRLGEPQKARELTRFLRSRQSGF